MCDIAGRQALLDLGKMRGVATDAADSVGGVDTSRPVPVLLGLLVATQASPGLLAPAASCASTWSENTFSSASNPGRNVLPAGIAEI